VPGGGALGICGVSSGNAAPLIDAAAGVEVHAPGAAELPTGVVGERVPVALTAAEMEVGGAPNGSGAAAVAVAAGAAIVPSAEEVDGVVGVAVTAIEDAVVVCAGDETQVTLVPGVVGSSASATGASVVSGAPEIVAVENGLGPVRGDDTMVPGVDGIPIAVVPMVETCARQARPPSSPAIIAVMKSRRIAVGSR
jgi:hypothetical protein